MEALNLRINDFERALLSLDRTAVENIVFEASRTVNAFQIAGTLVGEALRRIGDGWEAGKVALSQVYTSGILCEEIIDKILPKASPLRKDQPKMAIAVFEDHHVLGKRIVYSSLRASGYELMDLGSGVTAQALAKSVKDNNIKILLLSVLMLPSALKIRQLKEKLAGTDVKIIVGGAPFRFDHDLWKEVGADAMGSTALDAVSIVSHLMKDPS